MLVRAAVFLASLRSERVPSLCSYRYYYSQYYVKHAKARILCHAMMPQKLHASSRHVISMLQCRCNAHLVL